MKGLKQNILDFIIIPTNNPKTLVFADASTYIGEPERPLLEILLPGYNKILLVNIEAKAVNTLNSSTIGLNKALFSADMQDLPDGIWNLTYKVCPYNYVFLSKRILRTTILENRLGEVYEKLDLSDSSKESTKKYEDELTHIHILLEGAKAFADRDPVKAQSQYKLAEKLINKILDQYCKNCKNY